MESKVQEFAGIAARQCCTMLERAVCDVLTERGIMLIDGRSLVIYVQPDGSEVVQYYNEPILRMYKPEMTTETVGDSIVTRITRKWYKL